MYNNLIDFK